MNPPDHRRIVIVDGYSAGRELVRELLNRNVECVHLRSSARRTPPAGFDSEPYDADLGYVGDMDAAIQVLDELAPDAVVAGSERGAMFAEAVARGLDMRANKPELTDARRRALGALRLARRPGSVDEIGRQFTVNTVCRGGRGFVTDAWRMLFAAGDTGRRPGGFQLLDPDLPETETLFAFARTALGHLGIVHGAGSTQVRLTADRPALIGAAACLAGDPMDRAPYAAAGLDTQASVLAGLLAGAEPDRRVADRYRRTRHMTKLLFNFSAPSVIVSLTGLSRLRGLASFHSLHRPSARGERVGRNRASTDDGGAVYLVHDEAEQIDADARRFRLWESRGELYELAAVA